MVFASFAYSFFRDLFILLREIKIFLQFFAKSFGGFKIRLYFCNRKSRQTMNLDSERFHYAHKRLMIATFCN